MEEEYFKKVITSIFLIVLVVLSFFLLKPILMSIIIGLILSFIFYPVYSKLDSFIKSPNLSSGLVCFILILLIILPIWFLTPIVIDQSIKIFLVSQTLDYVSILKTIFPSLFASEEFSAEVGSIMSSFFTKTTNSIMNSFSEIILNFPTLALQSLVVFFTLFFVLRDKDKLLSYLKSLSPFPKEIENRLFDSSRSITSSVIYGQVIVGIIQGLILGVGLLVFRVPNALLLTVLACLGGILPIFGTAIVWVPMTIYLFLAQNPVATFGVLVFGLISSTVDNFLRPIIVSRRTNLSSLLILIGMIGGLFLFGLMGFILGPLVLAYLIIILELYRNKRALSILIREEKSS